MTKPKGAGRLQQWAMQYSIQNDPDQKARKSSTLSSQRRQEVCSQGKVEKGTLGGNNIYIYNPSYTHSITPVFMCHHNHRMENEI